MEPQPNEESFSVFKDKAYDRIKRSVDKILNPVSYTPKDVQSWVDSINQSILEDLPQLSNNFKYIVNTSILQRSNAGFHSSCACLWDYSTDEAIAYRFESKTMYCMTTVFAVAI